MNCQSSWWVREQGNCRPGTLLSLSVNSGKYFPERLFRMFLPGNVASYFHNCDEFDSRNIAHLMHMDISFRIHEADIAVTDAENHWGGVSGNTSWKLAVIQLSEWRSLWYFWLCVWMVQSWWKGALTILSKWYWGEASSMPPCYIRRRSEEWNASGTACCALEQFSLT